MLTYPNPVNFNTLGCTPFGCGPMDCGPFGGNTVGGFPNFVSQFVSGLTNQGLPLNNVNFPASTPFGFGGLPSNNFATPMNWNSTNMLNQSQFCSPQSCLPYGGFASPYSQVPFMQNQPMQSLFTNPINPLNFNVPTPFQTLPYGLNNVTTPFTPNFVGGFNGLQSPIFNQGLHQGFCSPFANQFGTPGVPNLNNTIPSYVPQGFGGINPAQGLVPNNLFNVPNFVQSSFVQPNCFQPGFQSGFQPGFQPSLGLNQNWSPIWNQTPFGINAPGAIGQINPFQSFPGGNQNYKVEKDGTVTVTTQISPNSHIGQGVPVGHREAA